MTEKTKDILLLLNRVSTGMPYPENFSIRFNVIEQICDMEATDIELAVHDLKKLEYIRVIKDSLDTIVLTSKGHSKALEILAE
jgi:hypothetical protein